MKYEIESYLSVGPIRLGMIRSDTNTLLGKPKRFLKNKSDTAVPVDDYSNLGMHVHYDDHEKCEAVEMFDPAQVNFMGKDLIGSPFHEIKDYFGKLDENLKLDASGFISEKFGFGVYAPYAKDEPHEPIEGVIVFRKGYYEKT